MNGLLIATAIGILVCPYCTATKVIKAPQCCHLPAVGCWVCKSERIQGWIPSQTYPLRHVDSQHMELPNCSFPKLISVQRAVQATKRKQCSWP
jgi:hypothetical protein